MMPSTSPVALARLLTRLGPLRLTTIAVYAVALSTLALCAYISFRSVVAGADGPVVRTGPAEGRTARSIVASGRAQAFRGPFAAETTAGPPPLATDFIWPADGPISQGMTPVHPNGIDISVNLGEPVRAVRAGRVVFAGGASCCEYGFHVIVEHDNGWTSLYAHLDALAVRQGDEVDQGKVIGLSGNTGKTSGPHLHFELRWLGIPVDPFKLLNPGKTPPPADLSAALFWSPPRIDATPSPTTEPPAAADAIRPGSNPTQQPAGPAPTQPPPLSAGSSTEITRDEAIMLAAAWMASENDAAYEIEGSSCLATRNGLNWKVDCRGRLAGCGGAPFCYDRLVACVFEQPFLVSSSCP